MENLNKNSIMWFLATLGFGWLAIETNQFESFVVFAFAAILAKQVEILSK
jgi:hypothetical protein